MNHRHDNNNSYEHLKWDSAFFGFKTARIISDVTSEGTLSHILDELKRKDYKLVYLPLDSRTDKGCLADIGRRGYLAARNATFVIDIEQGILPQHDSLSSSQPELYPLGDPSRDMEDLAIVAGEFSRFRRDPHFSGHFCDDLYKIWISRSTKREIAAEVLVVKEQAAVIAMATLGETNGRGSIGLFAVNKEFRRRGVGTKLLMHAHERFKKKGYRTAQVVTQLDNVGACRLYERCGYQVERVEIIFHFWL